MKKVMLGLLVLVFCLGNGVVRADNLVSNSDCASTHRDFSLVTCPEGYRVQGLAQSDLPKDGDGNSDMLDAISPVCRSVSKGNDMMPTDFQRKPITMMCEKTEIMIGMACKDLDNVHGNKDVLDACTAICQNPKNKAERYLSNPDFDSNGRAPQVTKILLPNRITGIAYKDIDQHSDKADCATVTYKYQPIVGE